MRTISATEAARNFSRVLDLLEEGNMTQLFTPNPCKAAPRLDAANTP